MKTELAVVVTAVGTPEDAEQISRSLVEKRLAACVQVCPITSHYRWDNALRSDSEWQLQIKTRSVLIDAVSVEIQRLHPYDVPEIIATPLIGVSQAYATWVMATTMGAVSRIPTPQAAYKIDAPARAGGE
jgi:periplasmic divalent cation tolerance protein